MTSVLLVSWVWVILNFTMYTVKNRRKRCERAGRRWEARDEHHNASEANWPGPRWRAAGGIERGPAGAGAGCAGGRRGHRASLPRDVRRAVADRNERRRHPPAEQRARHGYAPAPQGARESRQPRRVTSGLLLRPVPRPRRRASGLAIGGSHMGSTGAAERSRLAPGRGRRGTAAGSHGPGAVAARDHWAPHDDRRAHRA